MRADNGAKLLVVVVEPLVLQRVADDALHVSARLLEGNRFIILVKLKRQGCAPLRDATGAGIVSDSDIFDAPELVELVAHVGRAELNVEARLKIGRASCREGV